MVSATAQPNNGETEHTGAPAALRTRRFRYALATSVSSKVTSALMQIIAMPVAVAALGPHRFSLYAMLIASAGWITLANMGIGPTLGVEIAAAHARGDREEQGRLFTSAFVPLALVTSVVIATCMAAIWLTPVPRLFGPAYAQDGEAIRYGLSILVALLGLQTITTPVSGAQSGYQELHIGNLFTTVSSLPCIAAIVLVSRSNPGIVGMILAVRLPEAMFGLANAATIVARHRQVIPRFAAFSAPDARRLVGNGLMFSMAGGAGHFLAHALPVVLVGRACHPAESAGYVATMSGFAIAAGIATMVVGPLWPAIADSIARGDSAWAGRAYRRLLMVTMLFAGAVAVTAVCAGHWVFQRWFGGAIQVGPLLLAGIAVYFIAWSWEFVHFSVLVGLHDYCVPAVLVFSRAALGAAATAVMLRAGGAATPLFVMSAAIVVVSAWPLRRRVLAGLQAP